MPLTFTIAGLQAELQSYATARAAGDWDTAREHLVNARAIRVVLPDKALIDGVEVSLPKVESLDAEERSLAAAEAASEVETRDRRRTIRFGVSHG